MRCLFKCLAHALDGRLEPTGEVLHLLDVVHLHSFYFLLVLIHELLNLNGQAFSNFERLGLQVDHVAFAATSRARKDGLHVVQQLI